MIKKQITTTLKLAVFTVFGVGLFIGATPIFAAPPTTPPEAPARKADCAILPRDVCEAANTDGKLEDSGIWEMLKLVIRILTIGIGVVAVASLTFAGFLYTTAQESAEQTKKAKAMIMNTVIGLVAYGLMWALLQYLIPGGVF